MSRKIKVNLLKGGEEPVKGKDVPSDIGVEEEREKQFNVPAIASAVVLILGLIIFLAVTVTKKYKDTEKEQNAKKAKLAEVQKVLKSLEKYEKINEQLNLKLALIGDLKSEKKVTVKMMDYLSLNLPDKLWLTELRFNNNTNISLSGSAISQNMIIDFLSKLKGSKEFFNVRNYSTEETESEGLEFFNFDFDCSFQLTDGGAVEPDVQGNISDLEKYVYDPGNRADPFMNLMLTKKVKVKREKYEGLAALLIDEIKLEAIFKIGASGYKAMVQGPDGKPYILNVGDFLYDGEIIEINETTVKFKKSLQMMVDGEKSQIVEKTVNPDRRR